MLGTYLKSYIVHNRSSVVSLAAISLVACILLGLVIGVAQLLVTDYLVRMDHLGQTPDITGSTIAFALVTAISSLSVVLMLKSAFDVSMHARIRQLGLIKSVGATDAQVRHLLLAEGCALSLPAGCAGVLAGLGLSLMLVQGVLALTAEGRTYEPVVEFSQTSLLIALGIALVTIALSALLPARRLGKISVMRAISEGDAHYDHVRRPGPLSRLIDRMLGTETRLAISSLRARRRSMRTANISIALAILAFVTLMNFETLSHLSTQETYFERYDGVWDVRVTVKGGASTEVDDEFVAELSAMGGVTEVTTGDAHKVDSSDAFYNILTDSRRSAADVTQRLEARFSSANDVEVANLYDEAERDARSRAGLRLFVDVFAGVLAAIGIADVFASVLGRIPARRREVAQLQAAGISPRQIRRMFAAESVCIIARPLAWAAVLNAGVVILAVQASPVEMADFLANMPVAHVGAFALTCWALVLLAYFLGERVIVGGRALAIACD